MAAAPSDALALLSLNSTSNFPQQGQIDWAALSKTTISFTVEFFSRLSQANIEPLTILAITAISKQIHIQRLGEQRILDAIAGTRAFSTANTALWFGFGVKHIIRTFSESKQGVACVGLCACLSDEFGTATASLVLSELIKLYEPPIELTPSLRQWTELVRACEGILACTNFGMIVSQLSQICYPLSSRLLDPIYNTWSSNSPPRAIAQALKALFEVSNGTVDNISISGGANCAWIAAVGHWLLELQVEMQDATGNILYKPGNPKSSTSQDVQVRICMYRLYMNITLNKFQDDGRINFIDTLLNRRLMETKLLSIQILFTGRSIREGSGNGVSAFAKDGLCFFTNSISEVSTDPARTSLIHILPGRIEWNKRRYS
ncbi:hypothetical protein GQ44DRAFT_782693, partial [Phaeosphaeriaceae sp. PMI808]